MATPKNVYELAQERLDVIFREFDTICVSFSGGKDSGVLLNLCIDYIRRNRLNRKLCVFHMDYEIQYSMTIDYVDRVLEANKDILEVYRVCVPFRVTTCTSMYQSYWRPWQEDLEDIWVRKMPKGCLTKETFPFYTPEMWDYEFQMHFAKWLHEKNGNTVMKGNVKKVRRLYNDKVIAGFAGGFIVSLGSMSICILSNSFFASSFIFFDTLCRFPSRQE